MLLNPSFENVDIVWQLRLKCVKWAFWFENLTKYRAGGCKGLCEKSRMSRCGADARNGCCPPAWEQSWTETLWNSLHHCTGIDWVAWVHCQSSTGYWVHCQLGIRYWVLGTGYWVLGTKLKCTALELTGSGCCTVSEAADELHHLLWDNISFYIQPEELFSDKTKN